MATQMMPSYYSHHEYRRVPWVLIAVGVLLPILATLAVLLFGFPA